MQPGEDGSLLLASDEEHQQTAEVPGQQYDGRRRVRVGAAVAVGLAAALAVLLAAGGSPPKGAVSERGPQARVGSGLARGIIGEAEDVVLPHEIVVEDASHDKECPKKAVSAKRPTGAPQPSKGCHVPVSKRPKCGAGLHTLQVKVPEPALDMTTTREFAISVPEAACAASADDPSPMSFWFHGQYGHHVEEHNGWSAASGYVECAAANNYLAVWGFGLDYERDAEGLGEVDAKGFKSFNAGSGWNTGAAGDEATCVTNDTAEGALEKVPLTDYSCYKSCVKLGKCGRCNWSTCHDDVAYVREIIKQVSEDYCVDLSRIYVGGQSNGGMFTHHLYQQMPGVFAAANPIYGLPLQGYVVGKHGETMRHNKELREMGVLQFHGRFDKLIPPKGGLSPASTWSWYYTEMSEVSTILSALHGCNPEATDISDKAFEVCPKAHEHLRCFEFEKCSSERRVINCMYDGHHGNYPRNETFGCLTFWFFNQFRRSSVIKLD